MKKSTILHLRIPFSFFLLPVFLLAFGVSTTVNWEQFWLSFFILHFLIYPASNGYNSYFDKDEESIGGLKNPPPVSKELYWVSLLLDGVALLLSLIISAEFMLMMLIYGLVSKAYSHPAIRLKKYPIIGWLAAGIFQGYFTYVASFIAINDLPISALLEFTIHIPGILSTAMLLGSYPMTQVYQHKEDQRRGDLTMSRLLGIKGTFHFTAIMFTFAMAGFGYYFKSYHSEMDAILFFAILSPVLIYFLTWYFSVRKDEIKANFSSTMRLNFLSAICLNTYFILLWLT